MVNPLHLKLLGSPQIFSANRLVKFATHKAQALLIYLVVEGGLHYREKLMTLFWPESTTPLAQSALRNTLLRIKKALAEVPVPLLIESNQVGFNFASDYALDLEQINQALAFQSRVGDPIRAALLPAASQLPAAVLAVRGHFLDGFSVPDAPAFDDWVDIQRVAWDRRMDLLFDQLSLQQMELRKFDAAVATVTRWIGLNNLNEAAYRRLMRLHFINGDTAAALQIFNLLRDLLAQELDVQPAPRTLDLLAQIRSTPQVVFPPSTLTAQERTPLHLPFVGRASERHQLEHAYQQVLSGQTRIVAVTGESGIGKTRLAAEFLGWVGSEGADLLHSQAIEMADCVPYQPVIDALRERLDCENAPEDLLDDAWLAELTPILPELRERYPDLPLISYDKKTARSRLFAAVARLGQALAARRPLVWLLDDASWADPDTLDLLHYLAQSWHDSHTPVLLLLLLDQDLFTQNAPLRDWLSALSHGVPTTHLTLSSLQLADLQQLVLFWAAEKTPGVDELGSWLFKETAGQPFFLSETLAALDRDGVLVWADKDPDHHLLDPLASLSNQKLRGASTLPPNIRDMIRSRLDRLSQPAAALLAAAAVLNRSCTFSHLCQVAGLDETHALAALDELLAPHLLLEDCEEPYPYTISHARIRDVVYTELHQAPQQIYHQRALHLLAAEQVSAAELAYHAVAARDWQAAFHYNLAAGDQAMRLFAYFPAVQHYEAALKLLRDARMEADREVRHHLYTHLGQAYEAQDRFPEAAALYREMRSLARV